MIVVRITMHVIPEKQLELTQTLLSMIEPTGKDAGCLNYNIFRDISDNNRFDLLQEWESRNDLNSHLRSQLFGVLLGTRALLNEPLNVQILTVSGAEGMEAVLAVRGIHPSGPGSDG